MGDLAECWSGAGNTQEPWAVRHFRAVFYALCGSGKRRFGPVYSLWTSSVEEAHGRPAAVPGVTPADYHIARAASIALAGVLAAYTCVTSAFLCPSSTCAACPNRALTSVANECLS
jgi:hypothetical protein